MKYFNAENFLFSYSRNNSMQPISDALSIIQVIQLILAPAVMINVCGLLLLGVGNKFSLILNRIRLLNEEKRKLSFQSDSENFSPLELQRLKSVELQLKRLLERAKLVRNSVVSYYSSIGCFVFTSVLIAAEYFTGASSLRVVILLVFLASLVVFSSGVLYAALDAYKGYDVVKFEVSVDN